MRLKLLPARRIHMHYGVDICIAGLLHQGSMKMPGVQRDQAYRILVLFLFFIPCPPASGQ